jgi:hypothetical protein
VIDRTSDQHTHLLAAEATVAAAHAARAAGAAAAGAPPLAAGLSSGAVLAVAVEQALVAVGGLGGASGSNENSSGGKHMPQFE